MFRPLASLLHRSGIFSYLRRSWRRDDTNLSSHLRRSWRRDDTDLRQDLTNEIARQVGDATAALTQTITAMHQRQSDVRRELKLLRAVLATNAERRFERHQKAMDFDAVATHAAAAITSARIETAPMPHLNIESILPDATYRALIDATPPDECFTDRDRIKQNFRRSQAKLVPEFTAAMWAFFEDEVIPQVLTPALLARFRPHIEAVYAERYGELASTVSALPHRATAGRLMLRRPGYHLAPHLDPRRVIVTCLIYLARPDDDASFGTQLFAVQGLSQIEQSKTYYPGQSGYQCSLEKTVPFTANTAVAFLNAGSAAHGVTIPATAPEGTKRYAYQFYVSPDAAALAAVTGETADEHQD